MRNDSGAENRGGFKVVGEGAGPDSDAAAPQANETASSRKRNLRPKIIVIGLGGAGGNAIQNMLEGKIEGVELIVANTDAQALEMSKCERRLQLGEELTGGLGAGGQPEVGRAAAVESLENVLGEIDGASLVFIAAGMGGGTGTGSAPVIAEAIRRKGILTVAVVTKPFRFEGEYRMEVAEQGIEELQEQVDTLIVIPNQNLFKVATEKTSVADAFHKADNVLFAGVRGVTDLMVKPGLINLDFADFRTVMTQTGKAIMGAGEADGPERAVIAAEAAVANPLLEDSTVDGARGVLINVTGGRDLTLFELDQAVSSIRAKAHPSANIILGSAFDESLKGKLRVSVLATGILEKAEAESGKAEAASDAPKPAEPAAAATPAAAETRAKAPAITPEPVKNEAAAAKQDDPEPAKPAAEAPGAPQAKASPAEPAVEPGQTSKAVAGDNAAEAPASPSSEKATVGATSSPVAETAAPVAETETSSSEPQKTEAQAPESSQSLASPPAAPKETPNPEAKAPEARDGVPPTQSADPVPQAPEAAKTKPDTAAAEGPKAPADTTAAKTAPAPKAAEKGEVSLDEILKRAYLKQAEAQQAAAEAAKAEEKAPKQQAPSAPKVTPAATQAPDVQEPPAAEQAPAAENTSLPQAKPAAEPAASTVAAEAALDEDGDIDRLIEQVLTRNRKAAETGEPAPEEAPPAAAETVEPAAEPEDEKASADALLEDLAFSLAQDDAFQLDDTEPLPELKVEPEPTPQPTPEPEAPDLDELLDKAAAETETEREPAEPRLKMPPAESGNDDEELYAELDRRARERARAALEGLSLDGDGDGDGDGDAADPENKAATPDEDTDETLKQMMKLPSFLREKNS